MSWFALFLVRCSDGRDWIQGIARCSGLKQQMTAAECELLDVRQQKVLVGIQSEYSAAPLPSIRASLSSRL